jgi:hypothetical protein
VAHGTARVALRIRDPAAAKLWAVSTAGRRLERVATAVEGDRLVFTADVKGADGARMMYEIAWE